MKIPTPQELRQIQQEHNGPLVEAAVSQIIAGMKKVTSGRIIVDVHVPHSLQALVSARFAESGWSLKFWDDQRDGSSVEVIPR